MKTSNDRIPHHHVGSLPRPADLLAVVEAKEEGKPVDEKAHAARLRGAVAHIVRKQIELGIDIVDDGEFGKPSFVSYVNERLRPSSTSVPLLRPWWPRASQILPRVLRRRARGGAELHGRTAPTFTYRGMAQLQTDIDNLKGCAERSQAGGGLHAGDFADQRGGLAAIGYLGKTEEEYLFALADALREEYEAIVKVGFLLQVDDLLSVTYWIKEPDLTMQQCRTWAELRVEALNHALRNIAPEKIRHHTCYGINMGRAFTTWSSRTSSTSF